LNSALNHGLTNAQLKKIKDILSSEAHTITRVDLFGSRAKGTYRFNSDIDLVLHGSIDEKAVDRLWTKFAESNLPFKVDVKAYALVNYPPLQAHMDQVCQILFTQADLQTQ
jgi:predicted nucleotidyltransferase